MRRILAITAKLIYRLLIRWFGVEFVRDEVKRSIAELQEHCEAQETSGSNTTSQDVVIKQINTEVREKKKLCMTQADVVRALQKQELFVGIDKEALVRFFSHGDLRSYKLGEELVAQGSSGDDVYFIFEGEIGIDINGMVVDSSSGGECVGEMIMFDNLRRRSASLVAKEDCIVFALSATEFKEFIRKDSCGPDILYNISSVMAARLRRRGWLCRAPNKEPLVFIGSSSEAKRIADCINNAIKVAGCANTIIWTEDDMFRLSMDSMSSIEQKVSQCDFAILILSKDDVLEYRKKKYDSPRDNVIFELGYCMGKIGTTRSLFMFEDADKDLETKLPSDLHGLTYIPFKRSKKSCEKAAAKILKTIEGLGVRK